MATKYWIAKNPNSEITNAKAQQLKNLSGFLVGSETKDFGSVSADAGVSEDVTVTGAALGDFALCSIGVDSVDLIITCAVTAANTVTVTLENQTAGAIDLASTTIRCLVVPLAVVDSYAS